MRRVWLPVALVALGCGGRTAVDVCSGGPPSWDSTIAGQGVSVAVDTPTNDILLVTVRKSEGTLSRMTEWGQDLWRRSRPGVGRVASSANGDIFVSGGFSGSLGWAPLDTNASFAGFVARLDSGGAVRWAHKLEANGGRLTVGELASDSGGRSAALFHYTFDVPGPNSPLGSGFLLVELDPAGNELWRRKVWDATSYAVGTDLAFDPTGNVVVSAHVDRGSIDVGSGPVSAGAGVTSLVVKYGRDGSPIWSRALPGTGIVAQGVACDSNGNVEVAGIIRREGARYTSKPFLTEVAADGTAGATFGFDTGSENETVEVATGACGGVFVVASPSGHDAEIIRVAGMKQPPEISPISPSSWASAAAVDRNGALVSTGTRTQLEGFVKRWRP